MKNKQPNPTPVRFPPDTTLDEAKTYAKKLGISLNKYIVEAVKIRIKSGK